MDYATLPALEVIRQTVEAVQARGINAEFVETREEALARLQALIPPGCVVMTGSSAKAGLQE